MPIPFAPTKVTVQRPVTDLYAEPYAGDEQWETVATGVRASIGTFSRTVSATERRAGGEQSSKVLQLTCDIPASGITHNDRVVDETTGEMYSVNWVFKRIGLGLDHYTAEIFQWEGLVS